MNLFLNMCANPSVLPSLSEIAEALGNEYEIESLVGGAEALPIYRSMCKIIASMLIMPPRKQLANGYRVMDFRDEYKEITGAHLELAYEIYQECSKKQKITDYTSWMQVVLCDTVRKLEPYYENQVNVDLGG